MWGVKLGVLVLGLLVLVPESTQLRIDHPLHSVVQKLNLEFGPYLGLVISSGRDENILTNSTYFTPHKLFPSLTISGRKFNFGRFQGVPTVYVLAGDPLANVGATVQLLIDLFPLFGIVHYGSAATVTRKVSIGDVVVPTEVIFTGSLKWHSYGSVVVKPGLIFGDYNLPRAGDNALANIEYQPTSVYTQTSSGPMKFMFIEVYRRWVELASRINYDTTGFKVHTGHDVAVGTSDVYLLNSAYAKVLREQLRISAVDTHSAAVVTTAIANGIPHIVFRGTSSMPGVPKRPSLSRRTARNVLKTVATFVDAAAFPTTVKNDAMVN